MRFVILCEAKDLTERFRQTIPLLLFFVETLTTSSGEPVQARTPVVRRRLPLGGDPTCLFHAVEGRIQRPFFDPQRVVGNVVNMRGNTVAVMRTTAQGLEHEEVQRPLQDIGCFRSASHDLEV